MQQGENQSSELFTVHYASCGGAALKLETVICKGMLE